MQNKYIWQEYYQEGVPAQIEIPNVSLYYFLEQAANKYPDNQAILFLDHSHTFKELKERVDRFATALHNLGIKKGDRVAIMLPNCPQTVISYYAIIRLGAVAVLTNPLFVERELAHQLNDSGAEVIIVFDQLSPKVQNVLSDTQVKAVISTGIQQYLSLPENLADPLQSQALISGTKEQGNLSFEELLQKNTASPPQVELDIENDLAILQYTGGTTGYAKGAMLTHKNLVANVSQTRSWLANCQEAKEKLFCVLPFFHAFAMTTCMNLSICLCSSMILIPRLDVMNLLKQISLFRPTIFQGVPSLYVAVISHPDVKKYDLSSISFCISGGAPLPAEVQEKFEALTGAMLVEGYGLTEASPVTHCNPITVQRKNGSIGLPFPNTSIKIVSLENGTEELPLGEVGELCIKGPQVMKGYWNKPEESAEFIRNGWLHTGDVARIDEQGFTYIVDRKKDMVISMGYNVYPREVEEVLYEHPKVKEAAVIGIPERSRGEVLKAFVVLKEGQEAKREEIIKFCRKQLAQYKVPKQVEFCAELPKSTVGKILRRVLVEEEMARLTKK